MPLNVQSLKITSNMTVYRLTTQNSHNCLYGITGLKWFSIIPLYKTTSKRYLYICSQRVHISFLQKAFLFYNFTVKDSAAYIVTSYT